MGQAKLKGKTRAARVEALWASHSVKPLTPERYNAFIAWTRSPIAKFIGQEIEFLSTLDEHVIGVLILDREDEKYGYVTLGRDEKGRYRCIGVKMDMTKLDAQHALLSELSQHFASGIKVFSQGDEAKDKGGVDLFTPIVSEEKLSETFKLISTGDFWTPARLLMSEMMRHFYDVDGNFVEQFQTTAFDSRIWELYLYAALLEEGLFVEKPNPAPDFLVSRGRKKVFIEAVTVNPSAGDPLPMSNEEPDFRSYEDVRKLNQTKIPIKFGSALWSKLTRAKPYWEMKDVAGHPLVFAIADFHEKQSMTWTSNALIDYLYGLTHDFSKDESGQLIISAEKIATHDYEGKKIPSGFFLQPNSEHISAVMFSASGTISKFDRMGMLAGFGLPGQRIVRTGTKFKHDKNSALPEPFSFEVKQGEILENWAEGLSLFHNPKAIHPVDRNMFPNIAHHYLIHGQIHSYMPEFHPFWSYTLNFLAIKDGTN